MDEWIEKVFMNKQMIVERTNLFEPNVYIGMYVELDGNPSVELMKDAIQKAFKKNELTMSKVVMDKTGQAYYQRIEQSGCKVIITENDWKSIIAENEKQPFDIKCGEMMRVFVKENGKLFFMAHHLVGDGRSIITFLQDVLTIMEKNEVSYKPANILTKEFLQTKGKLDFLTRKYIGYQNKAWEKEKHQYSWEDYEEIHKRYWAGNTSDILTHTFNDSETEHIKKMAKLFNVTVNSYLISRTLWIRKDFNLVGIPVNIREDDNSMSNQVSGIAIKTKFENRKKIKEKIIEENIIEENIIEEKTKVIHAKIQKRLNSSIQKYYVLLFMSELCPTLIDAVLLAAHGQKSSKIAEKLAFALGYKGVKKRDLGVSNLGVIKMKTEYGNYKVHNLIFIPPSISYTDNIIGVSTVNDKLTITYHSMKDDEENRWFNELIFALKNEY